MTDKERVAWRKRTDRERQERAALDRDQPIPGRSRLLEWTLEQQEIEAMAAARGRKPKVSTQALKLAEALSFVSLAARDDGEHPYKNHVRFADKWAVTFDGVIAAGHPIEEDLACNPHAARLLEAINKCGKTLAIAELDSGRLSVKGEKLNAKVPCLPDDALPPVAPDPSIATIDDRIKAAFETVGPLVTEAGADVIEAAVLLQANSASATNRVIAIEHWHGIDLPPGLVVPKLFVTAVLKSGKKLAGFGWTQGSSITFHFEDGAWLKTQLYADQYPDLASILNAASYPVDVPEGFFEGIETVATFHDLGHVIFAEGKVMSHPTEEVGAQYDVPGLPAGKSFDGKLLKKVAGHAKTIDLTTYPDRAFFFGGSDTNPVRGLVMSVHYRTPEGDQ